jgi:hypothetical protein
MLPRTTTIVITDRDGDRKAFALSGAPVPQRGNSVVEGRFDCRFDRLSVRSARNLIRNSRRFHILQIQLIIDAPVIFIDLIRVHNVNIFGQFWLEMTEPESDRIV